MINEDGAAESSTIAESKLTDLNIVPNKENIFNKKHITEVTESKENSVEENTNKEKRTEEKENKNDGNVNESQSV